MTPADHRGDGETPPKGTLFCHECDHQSRYDGDWVLAETERGTAHLCPECGATITVRPAVDGDDGDGPDGDLWRAWGAYSRAAVIVRRFTANACWRAASASLGNAKW